MEWTNPNDKLAKLSCAEEEVGNVWYTHTFFVLKRSVLHSFFIYPLTPVCVMLFPKWHAMLGWSLYIITYIFSLLFLKNGIINCFLSSKSLYTIEIQFYVCWILWSFLWWNRASNRKDSSIYFKTQEFGILLKKSSQRGIISFVLLKKSSQRGITKRWKRKILNWITYSISCFCKWTKSKTRTMDIK